MSGTAELIRSAREQRGLSQRALADRAGVEQSTIARIELGDADPAYSTVVRLLDAAGFRLPEPEPSIPTLAEAATGGDEVDWTMLRSVTDLAERDPSSVRLLIGAEPSRTADTIARTILAAVAAFLAEQAGIRAPAWARHTPPLDEPWHPTGTPRMVRHTIAETPPAMARYNVWLRTSALRRRRP
ncbi:MAG: helix-turn-helix domain-containing protein [Actinobacteria bacterium]|nr:helix-turn-helix domain-containing protein [Actinomycetota bacterium]